LCRNRSWPSNFADHAFDPGPNGPSHPRAAVAEGPADRAKDLLASEYVAGTNRTDPVHSADSDQGRVDAHSIAEEMRTKMNSTLVGTSLPVGVVDPRRPRVSAWSIERSSVQYFLRDAEKPNPCGATCCQIPSSR
jgi:hypothetical protein